VCCGGGAVGVGGLGLAGKPRWVACWFRLRAPGVCRYGSCMSERASDTVAPAGKPAWVRNALRAREICEVCASAPATQIWADSGQGVCNGCCDRKRAAALAWMAR